MNRLAQYATAKAYGEPRRRGSRIPTLVWLILLLLALIAGLFVGHFVLRERMSFGAINGKTTIAESDLDDVVATYTYEDEVYEITARDAIAQASSLDAMKSSDGSYRVPSTESIISAARTAILMRDVEERGITVTDEELAAYASSTFGTDDFASLAMMYSMDEATVRDRMRESASIARLREQVAPASTESAGPTPPTAPADGDPYATSAEYANYIFALAGAEWDATRGTWASYDGPYATALKEYEVHADSATYAAAQTAYNVAYQLSGAGEDASTAAWTAYVNERLCKAKLAVSSLAS